MGCLGKVVWCGALNRRLLLNVDREVFWSHLRGRWCCHDGKGQYCNANMFIFSLLTIGVVALGCAVLIGRLRAPPPSPINKFHQAKTECSPSRYWSTKGVFHPKRVSPNSSSTREKARSCVTDCVK